MTPYQVFRNTLVVTVTLAVAYLLVLAIHVWLVLLVAILVASALRPSITRLRGWGLPQGFAILIVYGIAAIVSIAMLVAVLPPVINQFAAYVQDDDRLANRIIIAQNWAERFISQNTGTEVSLGVKPEEIHQAVHEVVDAIRVTAPTLIVNAGNFLGDFILIIVMGIYWITSRDRAEEFLVELLPVSRQAQARAILDEIEFGLGAYVRGITMLSIIIGLLCFVALTLLQVQGAATLSLVYAVATIVPIIGGFVGVVTATALAVLSSPSAGLEVLLVTVILQQIEVYILAPRVMSKSADFDEILVIVFIAAGFTLNGVMGATIAIPVAGTVAILLKHLVIEPRKARVAPDKVEGGLLLQHAEASDAQSELRAIPGGGK